MEEEKEGDGWEIKQGGENICIYKEEYYRGKESWEDKEKWEEKVMEN